MSVLIFCFSTQILIGYRNGEKKYHKVGAIAENGLYSIWAYALIAVVFVFTLAPYILDAVIASPIILSKTKEFLQIRIFTLFFSLANVILRLFFVGIQKYVKHITISSILCAVVNFVLDYLLIFGKFGFPAMGLKGAALASVLCEVVALLYFVVLILVKVDRKKYQLFYFDKPSFKLMKENISLSFYLMLQNLFSLLSWFLLFAIIEKTGEHNLAASNMARSYYILFLTPLWAYQASCSSFVSNAIGAGQFSQVSKIIKRMLIVSVTTGVIVILPMLSIPKLIMSIFTESPQLIEIGSRIFYPIALGTLIGTISQILVTTIAATRNTKFVLLMETISVIFYLIWGYWAAFSFPTHIEITWFGESIYYLMLVIIGGTYIRRKIIQPKVGL